MNIHYTLSYSIDDHQRKKDVIGRIDWDKIGIRRQTIIIKKGCTKLASTLPFWSWLENSLLALDTVLPMSASERRLDFLVW